MAKNITLTVPDDVYALMKEHGEINWSNIARKGLEAFAKVLEQADKAEKDIYKAYGKDVSARFSMGISENTGTNRYPAEAGMSGYSYYTAVNFNMSVQPARSHDASQQQAAKKEDVLKDATKG